MLPPSLFHNGSKTRDSVPLRNRVRPLPSFHIFLASLSEGVQFSCEIVPPSEGEYSRHVRYSVCSRVFLPFRPFPPSEGVQNSRVFAPPSEGAWRRQ